MAFTMAKLATLAALLALPTVMAHSATGAHRGHLHKRDSQPITSCTEPGITALTFDDGVREQYDDELLPWLAKNNATSTWFINGNNYDCIYDEAQVKTLRAIHAAGHLIASHTWSHARVTTLSRDEMHAELEHLETAMIKILGLRPKWFRHPYGEYDQQSMEVLAERGYKSVNWDTHSGDSDGLTVDDTMERYAELQYPDSHIVLNHVTIETTVRIVIPNAIPRLASNGYAFVDVASCLGETRDSWYEVVGEPQERDETWTCEGKPQPTHD